MFPEDPRGIKGVCKKYKIENYRIENGLVHVNGPVNLNHSNLVSLPVRFGKVNSWFDCSRNYLTSLEGSPIECGDFYCGKNSLTSLLGAPDKVKYFSCWHNSLRTLEGLPLAKRYAFGGTRFRWINEDEFPKLVALGKEFGLSVDEILCLSEGNPNKDSMIRLLSKDRKNLVKSLNSFYKIIKNDE